MGAHCFQSRISVLLQTWWGEMLKAILQESTLLKLIPALKNPPICQSIFSLDPLQPPQNYHNYDPGVAHVDKYGLAFLGRLLSEGR